MTAHSTAQSPASEQPFPLEGRPDTGLPCFAGLSYLLSALLTAIVGVLVYRSGLAVMLREVCVEEG